MSESLFPGFGQFSRPDIGLASDSFANLSEIFESDKRNALRNIQIQPEVLDSLYGLYAEISREDLRAASGLNRLLLPSLHQLSEVFLDRIPTQLYVNKDFYNPEYPLGGGGGSPLVKSPNIVLFNGSIQCESASYRQNVINPEGSIFGSALKQNVAMSTSRASLFNAEADTANPGYFKSARYAGSIRVRRRSHVNRILLPKTSFLAKPGVLEFPTHTINLNVDNNTGTSEPVRLLATKNTPLRVYCRMATGSIKFTFTENTTNSDRFFYGLQIQPAQQRPNTTPIEFLPVTISNPAEGVPDFTANIDITTTGFQNIYDLYLYIYVNPLKVKGIEFSGIDVKEFPDQKDLGLIGFSNLETFKMSGGSMTILPLWLKTLRTKLRTLDLSTSGDRWRNGPMGWFDVRNPSATTTNITGVSLIANKTPLYTAVSYLTVPQTGVFLNEDGDDWSDDIFEKYLLNQSRTENTDYRVFSALETLRLGDRFYGRSPRFDDVFPGLKTLDWSNSVEDRLYRFLFNNLPKIANNGKLTSYNIYGSGASGDITDVGTSTDVADAGYVSKYNMGYFNIGGRHSQTHAISGFINNPDDSSDWSAWKAATTSIDINRTNVSIDLQNGEWTQLQQLNAGFSGGVKFDTPISSFQTSPLKTPKLVSLSLYGSNTDGPMPSLGTVDETSAMLTIDIGSCNGIDPVTDNTIPYLLPVNFAPNRGSGSNHKLKNFYVHYYNNAHYIRSNDLQYLYDLGLFYCIGSRLTGRFPKFPLKEFKETETKSITLEINRSDFYDLSSLSITPTNDNFSRDVRTINAWKMNVGGGGAILPNFEGSSEAGIRYVDLNGSLPSTYRSDWSVASLRGACVRDSDPETTISGLSLTALTPSSSSSEADVIYKLTGGTDMKKKVQVNDEVRLSAGGPKVATVLSVKDTEVVISNNISGSGSNFYFGRKTIDISGWFATSFTELTQFRARNCKLSGKLNIRSGFNKVVNTSYNAVDLSNNMISEYESGSLSKIFFGDTRRITVDLSNNNLPSLEITKIIEEVSNLESSTGFNNCLVKLSGNKLSSDNKYSNYSQQEIFPTGVSAGPGIVTSLNRIEQFQVYEEITIADDTGNSTTSYTQVSTQSRQVPGSFVSGDYYKTKRNATQVTTESELAVKYKNLKKIRIDLGFTYISPSSGTTIVSTTYENPTTRNGSITESGLTALTSCPQGVGAGTCWENSSGQVLKLIV
jgi:hypothetical protein